MLQKNKIIYGDALTELKKLPKNSIDCVITSPPYWALRDYGIKNQIGLEKSFEIYIENLLKIFNEVQRVLKQKGTCFVNMGDTYGGNVGGAQGKNSAFIGRKFTDGRINFKKPGAKSLLQIPSRFALAMSDNGWILRNEIIWHKPNAMPSSAKDRFTVDFEKVFFFVKDKKYFFDLNIIKEPAIWALDSRANDGRIHYPNGKHKGQKGTGQQNFVAIKQMRIKRTVWNISTTKFRGAHFATFPEKLIEPMILAGCPRGGVVLDMFFGAGTTGVVALKNNRNYIGIELNKQYIKMAKKRLKIERCKKCIYDAKGNKKLMVCAECRKK